ncbi:hypothetical protein ROLI_025260 [Roseobacter fucihabitans]|uniref:Uncharacterized protein n=1 Tax=Roseobacter fucihabitans TaxID=1537242 RepID=A0ABZ2BTT5_9RHOB|nr:hypothetical protein [Roseobacter litoralis]MBC6967982.1 hypothetical protein [Roseobacter litoralis]
MCQGYTSALPLAAGQATHVANMTQRMKPREAALKRGGTGAAGCAFASSGGERIYTRQMRAIFVTDETSDAASILRRPKG